MKRIVLTLEEKMGETTNYTKHSFGNDNLKVKGKWTKHYNSLNLSPTKLGEHGLEYRDVADIEQEWTEAFAHKLYEKIHEAYDKLNAECDLLRTEYTLKAIEQARANKKAKETA